MSAGKSTALVALIEERYGRYSSDELEAVSRYLGARLEPAMMEAAFDAIREACPLRYGAPDLATVKAAIIAYESEYGVALRRHGVERSVLPPEPTTAADEEELLEIARRSGIDVKQEGWMALYLAGVIRNLERSKVLIKK